MIDKQYIYKILHAAEHPTMDEIETILDKATKRKKLNHLEIAMLLNAYDLHQVESIYEIAGKLKEEI